MVHPKAEKALEEAKKLVAQLESYDDNPVTHQAVLKQTEAVRIAIQSPMDRMNHLMEQVSFGGAFQTIIGTRAYDAMPENGSSITAAELAQITNVATTVIERAY